MQCFRPFLNVFNPFLSATFRLINAIAIAKMSHRCIIGFLITCLSFSAIAQPENVALDKPAIQSTTVNGKSAARAVDGNTSAVWRDDSITVTESSTSHWWRVDLEAIYDISDITIFNRTDSTSSRLEGATVMVGMTKSKTLTPLFLVKLLVKQGMLWMTSLVTF